jgi:hypothetical protein
MGCILSHHSKMKFNSDFWIVAATVSPVIALAAIVAFNEGIQKANPAEMAKPFNKSTSVPVKVQATVLLLTCFNGCLQTIILVVSLQSIVYNYNSTSVVLITAALGLGMLLIFAPGFVYVVPQLLDQVKAGEQGKKER